MPFAPSVQYRGDQYLFQAITGAADAMAQGVQKWRNDRQEGHFLDTQSKIMAAALAPGVAAGKVDPSVIEELAKFPSQSLAKKRGSLAGLMFQLDQWEKASREEAAQRRHQESIRIQEEGLGLQKRRVDAEEQQAKRQQAANADTLGWLAGMSGDLPSQVDPQNPTPYLRQQYPNAEPSVIESIMRSMGPMAQRRMAIDEGNLRVAEQHVERRKQELEQEGQPKPRMVKVSAKDPDTEETVSYEMPWDEYQSMRNGGPSKAPGKAETRTPAQVRADFSAGKITREQAVEELRRLGFQ